jgi:hypothetical protein
MTTTPTTAGSLAALIAVSGRVGAETDPDVERRVVILDAEEEPSWWLRKSDALELADRIRKLADEIDDPRPIRRLRAVDDEHRDREG